jgi:hypothetical protein
MAARLLLGIALLLAWPAGAQQDVSGRVVDAATGEPIAGAFVTLDTSEARSDSAGAFKLVGRGQAVRLRAPGYLRREVPADDLAGAGATLRLEPFSPKALYLSFFGIGSAMLRDSALELIEATELNALVIDVKGDRGLVSYRSSVPLAAQVGAQSILTIRDVSSLLALLHARGIYSIARIVVFKDNRLAQAREDLAVRTRSGQLWRDREQLAWTDPFRTEVWDYNIALAVEAARNGFDEIQFDYVRFPDAPELVFSQPSTPRSRVEAIEGFFARARQRLAPHNVFLAADVFGYVCWNLDDTGIGQFLETLAPDLDYVSPMLYPSAFQSGIPGYANPVQHSYEVVYRSLERAKQRTGLAGVRFRPWLQAFRDYAFDRRAFESQEIETQIRAAESAGSDGWMLWNPQNRYSPAGLKGPSVR